MTSCGATCSAASKYYNDYTVIGNPGRMCVQHIGHRDGGHDRFSAATFLSETWMARTHHAPPKPRYAASCDQLFTPIDMLSDSQPNARFVGCSVPACVLLQALDVLRATWDQQHHFRLQVFNPQRHFKCLSMPNASTQPASLLGFASRS